MTGFAPIARLAAALLISMVLLPGALRTQTANGQSIRPFEVQVPEKDPAELRRRISETRGPDRETVADTFESRLETVSTRRFAFVMKGG